VGSYRSRATADDQRPLPAHRNEPRLQIPIALALGSNTDSQRVVSGLGISRHHQLMIVYRGTLHPEPAIGELPCNVSASV